MQLLEIVHPTKGRLLIDPKKWDEYEAIGSTKVGEKVEEVKPQVPHEEPEQIDIEED